MPSSNIHSRNVSQGDAILNNSHPYPSSALNGTMSPKSYLARSGSITNADGLVIVGKRSQSGYNQLEVIQERHSSAGLMESSEREVRLKDEVNNFVAMLGDGDSIDLTDESANASILKI